MRLVEIDQDQVMEFLSDPELFKRIAEDGIQYSDYYPPEDHIYLGIIEDEKLIGFWWLHPENSTTMEIHCNILKEYRQHGVEAGWLFLGHVYKDFPESVQKLNCKIPVIYKDVYNFTRKFGFTDEGIDRKSIVKGGELVDQYILGITREEIKHGCS